METSLSSKMALFIKANGKIMLDKDMEFKSGQMVLLIKVSGMIIKLRALVNSIILMVMCTLENGTMIRLMDLVFIPMQMAESTWDTGKKIYHMDMALKRGLMVLSIMGNIILDRSMVLVSINGWTARCSQVNGNRTRLVAMAYKNGRMAALIKVNGKIIV